MNAMAVPTLSPRMRRLRFRCLGVLAGKRGLPIPSEPAFVDGRDSLSLLELMRAWEDECRSADARRARGGVSARQRRWWRRPAIIYAAGALVLGAAGVAALVRPPSARRETRANALPVWMPVDDVAIFAAQAKLLALRRNRLQLPVAIMPAELAAIAFAAGERPRWAGRVGLSARADSVLWLRGTTTDGRAFTLAAAIRVARPGLGELLIRSAELGSVATTSPDSAHARLTPVVPFADKFGRVRFALPRSVGTIRLNAAGPALLVGGGSVEQRR